MEREDIYFALQNGRADEIRPSGATLSSYRIYNLEDKIITIEERECSRMGFPETEGPF